MRRIHRALSHHDATLRKLSSSGNAIEREAFALMLKRVQRLQTESAAADRDVRALRNGLRRLGVDFDATDATIGRTLRRILGLDPRGRRAAINGSERTHPAD